MSLKQKKIDRRKIDGVFLLNKPLGISSNQALQQVRKLFKAEKAGHTGALDPLATGLLPICLGEATKFSHYLLDAIKGYETVIQLGQATTTGDTEGEICSTLAVPDLTIHDVECVLNSFLGTSTQIPPMYSALKKEGKPLYTLARQGIEIEREAREITIERIQLLEFDGRSLRIQVMCSKGTYIRVLGEDIAKRLGTVGHLSYLHRIQTGHFHLIPHYTLEYLASLDQSQRDALLLPVYAPVENLPRYQLSEERVNYFCHGQESNVDLPETAQLLVFFKQQCLGLATVNAKGRLIPKRILNLANH